MASPLHSQAPLGARHPVFNWTYATEDARMSASGLVAADIGKIAKQTDDGSYWELTAVTPAWRQVGGSADIFSRLVAYENNMVFYENEAVYY